MRALLRLAMGVLLTGVTCGCSAHAAFDNGSPGGASGTGSTPTVPLPASWRLGAPVSFGNLTVFPVIGDESVDTRNFITLDEGLRSGKIIITEIGAHGRSRRIRPGSQASDNAEVNKLMLTNRSGKTLVLIAGEMVVGGKQDRIVGHDCLVASSNTPVPLDVFCVEPGRWNTDAAFGQSRNVEPSQVRSARRDSGRGVGTGHGTGGGYAAGGSPGGVMAFSLPSDTIAPSNVREKAQAAKDQNRVWAEVAKTARENNTSSATGKLAAVFDDRQVNTKLEDYHRAFANKLSETNIVGVVVAVGGQLRSADVFATHSLFGVYWPKLLRSYSLEAAGAVMPAGAVIEASAAEAFLSRAEGAKTTNGQSRVYRLVEHQSDKDASFELVIPSTPSASPIHFNKVRKQ